MLSGPLSFAKVIRHIHIFHLQNLTYANFPTVYVHAYMHVHPCMCICAYFFMATVVAQMPFFTMQVVSFVIGSFLGQKASLDHVWFFAFQWATSSNWEK